MISFEPGKWNNWPPKKLATTAHCIIYSVVQLTTNQLSYYILNEIVLEVRGHPFDVKQSMIDARASF